MEDLRGRLSSHLRNRILRDDDNQRLLNGIGMQQDRRAERILRPAVIAHKGVAVFQESARHRHLCRLRQHCPDHSQATPANHRPRIPDPVPGTRPLFKFPSSPFSSTPHRAPAPWPKLRRGSFYNAGEQWMLHFDEKGGKSREIRSAGIRGCSELRIRCRLPSSVFRPAQVQLHPPPDGRSVGCSRWTGVRNRVRQP